MEVDFENSIILENSDQLQGKVNDKEARKVLGKHIEKPFMEVNLEEHEETIIPYNDPQTSQDKQE